MLENPVVLSLIIALGMQAFFFAFAWKFKTDKLTDLSYGLTFAVLAVLWLYKDGRLVTDFRMLVAVMVVLWAARLSSYLLARVIKTGRDKRYDEMRNSFLKFGRFWLLQGLSVWLIMQPVIYMLTRNEVLRLDTTAKVSLYIWSFGLIIEFLADAQLHSFRFSGKSNGKWIDEGLWHYSRHPNYFGEILLWWGVFIYGLSSYESIGWLTVVGPLTITGLLLFGSGIPILEKANDKRWGGDPEFQRYKATTSILIPLPKRKRNVS